MRDTPTNSDDIIDSRDVIARIEELRAELRLDEMNDAREAVAEAHEALQMARNTGGPLGDLLADVTRAESVLAEIRAETAADDDQDARERELAALEAFAKEGEDYAPDWSHGESCIRESYFTQYAEELANDIGAVNSEAGWPNSFIDWDKAAEALKIDYTEIDFDGVTYLVR